MVRSGSYAMRHSATNNAAYTNSQTITGISAGRGYSFAGWVNIPATTDQFTFQVELQWQNSRGTTLRTDVVRSFTAATSGWVQVSGAGSAPSNAARVQVRMVVTSLSATVYADDFSLTATP